MISIKTLFLTLFVAFLAISVNADHKNLRDERKLQAEESSGIYQIINGAVDLAEKVSQLCISGAIEDPAVKEFCDEAF